MTRLVQARLTDPQYDWLAARAIEAHDGDLSKAVREAITFAEMMVEVLEAPDSHAALDELFRRSEEAQSGPVDLYMDQPDDAD